MTLIHLKWHYYKIIYEQDPVFHNMKEQFTGKNGIALYFTNLHAWLDSALNLLWYTDLSEENSTSLGI